MDQHPTANGVRLSPRTDKILAELGLKLSSDGTMEFIDMDRAETGYIHHSRMPVALAGFAAISPAFARGRLPKVRLLDLVAKRPAMDEDEATAFAALGGVDVKPPFWGRTEPFFAHLIDAVGRHGVGDVFRADLDGHGLHGFRPLGYADDTREQDLKAFRRLIKGMTECQRILVATIITLYRGDAGNSVWQLGRWAKWHAADALATLRGDAQLSADWHKLVALYPGW